MMSFGVNPVDYIVMGATGVVNSADPVSLLASHDFSATLLGAGKAELSSKNLLNLPVWVFG